MNALAIVADVSLSRWQNGGGETKHVFSSQPMKNPAIPWARNHRHWVHGVGRGGGQPVFNQILTRFHGIRLNPIKVQVKFRLQIRSKSLEIMCFPSCKAYPDVAEKGKSG